MDLSAIFARLAETQRASIQFTISKNLIIVVHDDPEQIKLFQEISALGFLSSPKPLCFDTTDQCYDFVIEKVSEDLDVQLIIFVGGRLVGDLVSSLAACEQVKQIFILNKPPFDEEERRSMKNYPQVTYVADIQSTKTASDSDQPSAIGPVSETRFTDVLSVKLVNARQLDDDTYEEPQDRTLKHFDRDFVFRYLMLMCLLHAPPLPTSNKDLLELFEREALASITEIRQFRETYSPNRALIAYTKDVFIYSRLNAALRTKNIRHLLPFRFVLQDICTQLREGMVTEPSDQTLTLYRAQQSTKFEVADLIVAHHQCSPVVINSFFSTSRKKDVSLDFLDYTKVGDMNHFQILFIITARRQDASHYFPFADVSKISQHPGEEEVLFAPGQMFDINNIEISFQKGVRVHLVEMSLVSAFDKRFASVRREFETILQINRDDSLLSLARLLLEFDQLDEAKQLYRQCLSDYEDQEKKYACYQGLFAIAQTQNDTREAKRMYHTMTETRFGPQPSTTHSEGIPLPTTETDQFGLDLKKIERMSSLMSFDQPFDKLLASIDSEEFRNSFEESLHSQYRIGTTIMKSGMHALAIQLLEPALQIMKYGRVVLCDPLLKPRYYMQLGYGYLQLKLNDKALEFYELALEHNAYLPVDEYIKILIGLTTVYETINDRESTLYKHIEIAEIYRDHPTVGSLEDRQQNEECIRRVTSHLTISD